MKYLVLPLLLVAQLSNAGSLYQCKDEKGKTSFQDRPCKVNTVKVEAVKVSESQSGFNNNQFRKSMIKTLAKMTGKSERDLKDPKIRQAAEILAATDAAKSYAYTKIYGVSAGFCDGGVKRDLTNYKRKAADIIALGKYYYANGIQANVGSENLSKTGPELTEGLNGMLKNLEREHKSATPAQLKQKCRQASAALKSLAMVYAG